MGSDILFRLLLPDDAPTFLFRALVLPLLPRGCAAPHLAAVTRCLNARTAASWTVVYYYRIPLPHRVTDMARHGFYKRRGLRDGDRDPFTGVSRRLTLPGCSAQIRCTLCWVATPATGCAACCARV